MHSIRRQTLVPLVFLSIVISLYTALILAMRFSGFYLNDHYIDADRIAKYTVSELTDYRQIAWLFDYWEAHCDGMDLIFERHDPRFAAKEAVLREKCPTLTELKLMTKEELESLDEEGQRLYAELCYARLCQAFDRIKTTYDPKYLYCQRVRGDEIFFFVTGTKPGEVRSKDGSGENEVYQLGSVQPFDERGEHEILDYVLQTGKSPQSFDFSYAVGETNTSDAYEPVVVGNRMIGVVGVSIEMDDLTRDIYRLAAVVMCRTLLSMGLIALLVAVLLWLHVLRPIRREQRVIKQYEQDKDRKAAQEALDTIRSRNELQELAGNFSSMIGELDRYMSEIVLATQDKERSSAELAVAARIQAGALPEGYLHIPGPDGLTINASVKPAREVAGDFYDHFIIDEDHIGLTVADVSDKGVPASLFMMLSKSLLKNVAMAGNTPADVVGRVNAQLCENNPENMFVTVWFGIYCISRRELIYVNAGHEHPALYRSKTGHYDLIMEKHDPVIGLFDDCTYSERTLSFSPGDRIFLYTDGIPEATDADKEMYGTDRMVECLNQNIDHSGEEVLAAIVEDTGEFVGEAPQFDDMTMLLLEITEEDTGRMQADDDQRSGIKQRGAEYERSEVLPEKGGYTMATKKELMVEAEMDNLNDVLSFVDDELEAYNCPPRIMLALDVAVEELFTNIASYAYAPDTGTASVRVEVEEKPVTVIITFVDQGVPYDPLKSADPKLDAEIEDRSIGGFGIFMVKNSMDDVNYEYRDGQNILTIKKALEEEEEKE